MQCPTCSGETPEGKRFCASCGASLAAPCASCGAVLVAGKPFCADCGHRVGAPVPRDASVGRDATPRAAQVPPSSQRRLCSVLFVDLVGFTPRSAHADPEDVRELLSRYFARAEAVISSYGGTIEKFIGDAVMAVWGAPTANEDDAERAVRAALDTVAAVAALGREPGADGLLARAGVVTGEVAVSIGRAGEGLLTGDTVNVASRLQGAAAPSTVVVDEATWRATSRAVAYDELGGLALKGKDEVVPAWRALRVVAQRRGLGRAERLEPPFVGRDAELQLLKDLLVATTRERRARLVSVTGVPGVGKSRLAWEFLKHVDGLAETVYWHEGRSAAYGEGVTFGALSEMVRGRAAIDDGDAPAVAGAKLDECVATFVVDEAERRWVAPRLAHLLGLADAPSGDREELFSAWRTFLERVSERATTVLVFEDLQWADPGLVDFIATILEWSRSHPIMVVTLARPELRELRADWGAAQRSAASLRLDALDDDEMEALLAGLVAGLPHDVAARVRVRAEGIPLYAVETVRMLLDRGALVLEGDACRVVGDVGALELPETLQALVASRLDGLAAEERGLLQDAAILGLTFRSEALAALRGEDRGDLAATLGALVRREFLALDADARSPERGQYRFVQGVVAEVAAGMLAKRDRRVKHLAAAAYLASLADDDLSAAVAAHYVAAHAASGAGDTEGLGAAARAWLARAADRALSLGSPEQAAELLDQAIRLDPPAAERAELLDAAAGASIRSTHFERAVDLSTRAVEAFGEAGDRDGAARATDTLCRALGSLRRFSDAIAVGEPVFEALGPDGDPALRARLAVTIGNSFSHGIDARRALEWVEVALDAAAALEDPTLLANAIGTRAQAAFLLGRHREARLLGRGLLELAEESGGLREGALARMTLGIFSFADDPHDSLELATAAAALARRSGHRSLELTNLLNAAETAMVLGRFAEVRGFLDAIGSMDARVTDEGWLGYLAGLLEALTEDPAAGLERLGRAAARESSEFLAGATTFLYVRAYVELLAGDLVAARDGAARALELDPYGFNSSIAASVLGRAAVWLGDHAAAAAALAGASRRGGRWSAAVASTVGAGLAGLEGRDEDAAIGYAGAVEAWRALDCPLDLALAELDAVVVLGPDHPASVVAKEAADLFAELGARPLLARLEAARGRGSV